MSKTTLRPTIKVKDNPSYTFRPFPRKVLFTGTKAQEEN
jgi:hypothetical protein